MASPLTKMKTTVSLLFLLFTAVLTGYGDPLEERVTRLEKDVAALKAAAIPAQKEELATPTPNKATVDKIISVVLTNKRFQPVDYDKSILQAGIYWDALFTLASSAKATRAVKGNLVFTDLFDEEKVRVSLTINHPLKPGESFLDKDSGIDYNELRQRDQWLKTTELKDMKVRFEIDSVIYEEQK
jgi:hypothetical protein